MKKKSTKNLLWAGAMMLIITLTSPLGGYSAEKKEGEKRIQEPVLQPPYEYCKEYCGPGQMGKGYTVCERYLAYVNAQSTLPRCEAPLPPGFTLPQYEEVDFMQHLDWAYQIESLFHSGTDSDFRKKNPDITAWSKDFIAEMHSGNIAPVLRKVKIIPFDDDKEITLLAYSRESRGCSDVLSGKSKGSFWDNVGYVYVLLLEDQGNKILEITAHRFQKELLFFKGRPYFLHVVGGYLGKPEPGDAFQLFRCWAVIAKDNHYGFDKLCDFRLKNTK